MAELQRGLKRVSNFSDAPGKSPGHAGSESPVVRRAGDREGCNDRPNRATWNEAPVTNPFEDADALYLVLVNDEGQHSLWPADVAIPDGWVTAHDTDSRSNCLEYVEKHWTDMRPNSLLRSQA